MKCDICKKSFNRTETIYRVKAQKQPVYKGLYAYAIVPHMLYVCIECKEGLNND